MKDFFQNKIERGGILFVLRDGKIGGRYFDLGKGDEGEQRKRLIKEKGVIKKRRGGKNDGYGSKIK